MADWWAICLVDCLAPGPWSYVYVWALLFHMYRPQIIFYTPTPSFFFFLLLLPGRTDGIHIQTQAATTKNAHWTMRTHTHTHIYMHAYGRSHNTLTLRVMTCTRGDTAPADCTTVHTNRNVLCMCRVSRDVLGARLSAFFFTSPLRIFPNVK